MENKITGNEPAFPLGIDEMGPSELGMTLRQYYAGLMLQGMLSTYTAQDDYLANRAVKLADILIVALNKPSTNE